MSQRQQQQVQLLGITQSDIQKIIEDTIKQFKTAKTRIIYLDASYLYTFDKSDIRTVGRYTDEIRVCKNCALKWHEYLERWHAGESCYILDRRIKPLQIARTFDRVPNELLEKFAEAMAGAGDFRSQRWHAIGDGADPGDTPLPGDTALVQEVDRIDVTQEEGGGAMAVNGSTFFNIGNHDINSPSMDATEMGIFDREKPGTGGGTDDIMGDHSIFPSVVSHLAGQDAIGGTIVIYQCSS